MDKKFPEYNLLRFTPNKKRRKINFEGFCGLLVWMNLI